MVSWWQWSPISYDNHMDRHSLRSGWHIFSIYIPIAQKMPLIHPQALDSRKNLAHLLKPQVWSKFSFDNLPYKSRISNSVEDRYNSEGCSSIVCWGTHQSMIITFHMKQTAFRHVLRRHKCDTQWLFQIYQFNGLALSFLVSLCSSFILNLYSIIHSKKLSGLWSFR